VKVSANETMALRRLLPGAEFVALIMLLALFVVKALIPAWESRRSDFPNYYIVARLFRKHYALDRIYDWIWLQRVKDHWSIPQSLVGFVGLTPFSALPLVPFTWLGALEAKRAWLVANLAILAASLYGMQRLTYLGFRRIVLIAFLAIIPLRNSFLLGQMHLVVLGLLILAFWLDLHKKRMSCAAILSLAVSLKIYPVFFVFYFARKRQWRQAAVLAGFTLVIFAAGFLLFGPPVMRAYLLEQLPRTLRGEALDPFSLTAPSASSLFHRVFLFQAQVNPDPFVSSPLLYALAYPLWQLSLLAATLLSISPTDAEPRRRSLEWASWICLLLTLSTEPATYHKVVLIFVVVLAFHAIDNAGRRAILLGCYFLACNVYPGVMPQHRVWALLLDFAPYWGLVAMLACLLASLRVLHSQPFRQSAAALPWPHRRIVWALGSFAAVWAAVSATTFVHAISLNDSIYRIDQTSGAYARFSPHLAGGYLLTVAMVPQGYRVESQGGKQLLTSISGADEDQLGLASIPTSSEIWIEAVRGGHSQIVALQANPNGPASAPTATIFDAESPVLSTDGRRLVFLRETKGTGQAWMVRLDVNGQVVTEPVPVSPAGMDVREATFGAEGALVLSAAENGVPHLYATNGGAPLQRVSSSRNAMEGATANVEGAVTLREEERDGYWRLFAIDAFRGVSAQLTSGDCNAYDPAWLDATRVVYISDCGRGMGLGALAEIDVGAVFPELKHVAARATSADPSQGGPRE
jgi:hypothetical protein